MCFDSFLTVLLMYSCLIFIDMPSAIAGNPEVVLQGKEPVQQETLETLFPKLETVGIDNHGDPEEELLGQFVVAIGNNDIVEVARFLKKGVDVNQPISSKGQTPVMAAESLEMAILMYENGSNIKSRDVDGGTVLHYAVSREASLELIPYFIAHGTDVNARGWDDETPLFSAITYFNEVAPAQEESLFSPEQGNVLKKSGVRSTKTAANISFAQQVVTLLAHLGADINAADEYGNTILMQCVAANNMALVETLLELGVNTKMKNRGGSTAQDIAQEMGHRIIYQRLR